MTAKRSWKLQEFVGHGSLVTCAALGHKSGRVMATGGEDGKVNMWHVGSPNCIMSLSPLSTAVEVVHFNSCEELVCAGSRSGALRIWDLAASKVVRQLTGHKAAVRSVDFHPYGEFIASGSNDAKVRMWDIRRKGCIFTYKGHEGCVNHVEFSPDGRWISSASEDATCKIWDITAGKLLYELKDHSASVTCLQFHPREFLLATGSADRTSKVFDVEQFKMISSTPLEASPIQHILFGDSGECLYTASQDCCKVYAWEPNCRHLDTVLVKWGRPADITISADQLMGCSFSQNIVSVHIIDIKQLATSPKGDTPEMPSKEIHSARQATPVNQRYVTVRPRTSLGISAVSPALPKKIHCNNNNNMEEGPFKHIDEQNVGKIFNPSSTLARSPVKEKEADTREPESKPLSEQIQKLNVEDKPKQPPLSQVATAVSAPDLRFKQAAVFPSKPVINAPNVSNRVTPVSRPPAEASIKNSESLKNTPGQAKQSVGYNDFNPSVPLGGALKWGETKKIPPTRDENIVEKLGQVSVVAPAVEPLLPEPVETSSKKPEMAMTAVIPSDRQDPVGLDMNAFLPPKPSSVSTPHTVKTDMEAIASIKKGLESMRLVLTNRHKNLEIVRALWTSGDIMTSINQAVKMEDQALIVDLLNVLTLKPSLWNLDLCGVMLPQIKNLLMSKYETYTSVGCASLKLVLKNFAQVIRSNLQTPPSAVDISREERHRKCKNCYLHLNGIRSVLESKQQTSGKIGSQFRELKILISTLE
ncbi:unnamed protein product [Clavelina lepadiformis]|uniref:Katanin p80 WD40 repeat-containing subunit B1 n=1 Tax=Clavelina lepadiformis TaxID=159417 RepID=A0ABP0EYK5_CLALP